MSDQRASLPIAVFDSGVGGLTVLHELLVSLPEEDYLYLGDTAWFPYGTRPPDELRPRVEAVTGYLLDRGAKLLVVACNAATSAAADAARAAAAGHALAASVQRSLEGQGLATANQGEGSYRFLCTGDVASFREHGTRFLQLPLGDVEHVEVG